MLRSVSSRVLPVVMQPGKSRMSSRTFHAASRLHCSRSARIDAMLATSQRGQRGSRVLARRGSLRQTMLLAAGTFHRAGKKRESASSDFFVKIRPTGKELRE